MLNKQEIKNIIESINTNPLNVDEKYIKVFEIMVSGQLSEIVRLTDNLTDLDVDKFNTILNDLN